MTDESTDVVPVEWTAAGQVIRYTSERRDRWCREGWAISDEGGRFLDTYWMGPFDGHVLTAAELVTAEHSFWLDDYRELDRHPRTPDEWAKYAPEDRRRVTSQHGLKARYFVRHGASFDLPTQIENAVEALRRAEEEAELAERRLAWAQEHVDELRDELRDRSNLPVSLAEED